MAKMQVEGLEEYAELIQSISKDAEKIIKKSVYVGAGVIGDAIKNEIKKLPTDNTYGTEKDKLFFTKA